LAVSWLTPNGGADQLSMPDHHFQCLPHGDEAFFGKLG
jgi:hypothetical protein